MTPREMMMEAIKLAKRSKSEQDGRIHPLVGAVIARGDTIIATGFRGESKAGNHAEQEALSKIPEDVAANTTIYSTLEPCVIRGNQMPCSQRLIDRRISEVYYGMLDPNRDIRGQGEWKLEEHGIPVKKFDPDLVEEIREMNKDFIDYMLGLGITITNLKEGDTAASDVIAVRGVYRVHPQPGDRIVAFVRRDNAYYPQPAINFDFNRTNREWECSRVHVDAATSARSCEIIIARISEDFGVALRHYNHVADVTNKWIELHMEFPVPGFERLASVNIARAAPPTNG